MIFPLVRLFRCIILTVFVTLTTMGALYAHEVTPSVSDLRIEGQEVTLDITLNLESFLAGIDLETLTDTNDAPGADDYDRFRAMENGALESAFHTFWPQMAERIAIKAPEPLPLTLLSVTVPTVENFEPPRASQITLTATLPAGTPGLSIDWPAD